MSVGKVALSTKSEFLRHSRDFTLNASRCKFAVSHSLLRQSSRCSHKFNFQRRFATIDSTKTPHSKSESSDSRQFRLLVLGAPGVGKGTYSKYIAREFCADIMTSGDLLRAVATEDSADGKRIRHCIESGELVEDSTVIPMVVNYLRSLKQSFILDGFPRTLAQAKTLTSEYGIDVALLFTLPRHVLIAKILGRRVCEDCGAGFNLADIDEGDIVMPSMKPKVDGVCDECGGCLKERADDKLEVVDERQRIYDELHQPIIDHFSDAGCLLTHDIKKGIDDTPEIIDKINTFLGRVY